MDKFDKIIEKLGVEETLKNLLQALASTEIEENAEYIARMWDIEL